jgi:hypothetical protein
LAHLAHLEGGSCGLLIIHCAARIALHDPLHVALTNYTVSRL